ncbi:iron-siderophore ABC transporter substrate-binding protein [Deefgea rivuli]|uniref:iron-siderophore ABC transporter substrate-binding protein n=1 Tax=Deefgea rivuli TaxID=400948 RepID=UPI000685D6B3|nr:iron-siderophore ABC transporter substrate-binding protein [Deefgea rivuli]
MRYVFLLNLLLFSSYLLAAPSRVIALSWEATEYLLTLGITPLAVADRHDYQQWVIAPALPPTVLDAGSRLEPNLERIYALKPELIIINPALASMQTNLERIAPTLLLDSFKTEHDNAQAAEQLQRQLALRLGREKEHDLFLQKKEARLKALRQKILQRYGQSPPEICMVRFASPTTFWAYGENSMPEAAMNALGLKNACPQPRTTWGTRLRKVPDLAQLHSSALLLTIAPFAREAELIRSPLWQALPVVQRKQVRSVAPVWTNGGLYSTIRLAETMTDAITERQ